MCVIKQLVVISSEKNVGYKIRYSTRMEDAILKI